MAIYKRGETWWFKFKRHGVEIRQSARTKSRTAALRAERKCRNVLETGARIGKPVLFSVAAQAYLDEKEADWNPRTRVSEGFNVGHLTPVFKLKVLQDITAGDIARYQGIRKREGASGRTINLETGTLRAILRKHKLWQNLAGDVKPMKVRIGVGRALSDEEVSLLLEASQKSRSRGLYPALLISLYTGLRSRELRMLRWLNIDLQRGILKVGESKTQGGQGRVIPLSGAAFDALVQWRRHFPDALPGHYLFPTERVGLAGEQGYLTGKGSSAGVDPLKPIGGWKTSFNVAKRVAGVECRWHDLRHTFCSRVGETGVSEQTLIALSGWMSRRMIEVYSHPRMEAKRQAIAGFSYPSLGVGTKGGTVEEGS